MVKIKFKKGDFVRIIAGKHKNIEGSILSVIRDKERVIIEGVTKIKHIKPSQNSTEGGIKKIPSSVHISNVSLIDPKNKRQITKIGYKIASNGNKVRVARKSKAVLV